MLYGLDNILEIFTLHYNGQAVGSHKPFKETFDLGIIPTSCASGIIQLKSFSSLRS